MYDYEIQKRKLFTEDGQVLFLQIRDRVNKLLLISGAFRLAEAFDTSNGDSWDMLACIDRLIELKEIEEVSQSNVMSQHRVFVRYGEKY